MSAITTRTILACRDSLAAGFCETLKGLTVISPADLRWWEARSTMLEMLGRRDLPSGRLDVKACTDAIVVPIEADDIVTLHARAMAIAWRDGAWDIEVIRYPPKVGPIVTIDDRVVTAGHNWLDEIEAQTAAETKRSRRPSPARRPSPVEMPPVEMPLRIKLLDALAQGSLVTWRWRPMLGGPALRRKAHAHKDRTLRADGGRDGAPPNSLAAIDWSGTGGAEKIVRLGAWSDEHRPTPRPVRFGPAARATDAQRGYIVALRRMVGIAIGDPLPAALTRGQASAMIDALLAANKPHCNDEDAR